jgi:hypothetical protein
MAMENVWYNLYNESQKKCLISSINKIDLFAYSDQRILYNWESFDYSNDTHTYYITLYNKNVHYVKYNNNSDIETSLDINYSSVNTLIDLLEIEFKYHIRKLKIENMLKNV